MGFHVDEISTPGIQIFQIVNLLTNHLAHQLHVLHKDRKTWTRQLKCLSVPANGIGIKKIEQKREWWWWCWWCWWRWWRWRWRWTCRRRRLPRAAGVGKPWRGGRCSSSGCLPLVGRGSGAPGQRFHTWIVESKDLTRRLSFPRLCTRGLMPTKKLGSPRSTGCTVS